MRKLVALCAAVVCFSCVAAAQDHSGVLASPTPAKPAAGGPAFNTYESYPWQVSVGYEYVRANALGPGVNLNGFHTSLTRFSRNWLGLEAAVGAAWGHTPDSQTVKFLWYGGGPRVAFYRQAKITPWVHGLFGGAHLFPQTALGSTTAFSYLAGGGVDVKLSPHVSWRVQGDFVGTRFFSQWQSNGQVSGGLVLNF